MRILSRIGQQRPDISIDLPAQDAVLPKLRIGSPGFFLLIAFLFAPRLTADQIVLKNGDRVTGSIVKKDDKTVTIKTLHFGLVTTAWDQVSAITADAPLSVVLPGGKTLKGTLATTDGDLAVRTADQTESVPLAQVEALRDDAEQKAYERLLNPRVIDLWTVNGSLALAGARGNAKTFTLLLPITASRVTRHDKTSAYFNFIRSSALVDGRTQTTARAVRGGWAYNRNLTSRLFWTLFNDYDYDRFQNLDLRVVIGSGGGFSVWKGEGGSQLDLVGGLAWNREAFDPPRPDLPFDRNALEGFWGNNFTFKFSDRSTLTQSYRMFNNLKDAGAREEGGLRQNFDLNLTTTLTRWLTWNASVSDRYLNRPVQGRKKNDFLYATGLGFNLSR
jgi:hypothetical protein